MSCAWWPDGEYVRFSIFSSHLAEGDDISELFYSASLFNHYKADEYSGPHENLVEWYNYFDGKYSIQTIDQLIYRYDYERRYYDSRELRDSTIENNALYKHLKNGGHPEASEYLFFAIKLEDQLYRDPWGKQDMDISGIERSFEFAEQKLKTVKDEQIKLRYAYQLVVMSYYLGNEETLNEYYENFVLTSPEESVIKVWSKFYYAMFMDDYNDKLYLWSRVFDESKSKCRYIFRQFPEKKDDVLGVLQRCNNDREKGAVLSILAFKNPGRAMDQIKEIADLNANDELIDILLIREINKMEDWYFTEKYTSYSMSLDGWWDEEGKFAFINEKEFPI